MAKHYQRTGHEFYFGWTDGWNLDYWHNRQPTFAMLDEGDWIDWTVREQANERMEELRRASERVRGGNEPGA